MTSTTVCHAFVLRYRDPETSLVWLCQVLGFSLAHEDRDDRGKLRYAQVRLGNALVMIGRVGDAGFDGLMAQPDEVGGVVTSVPYFLVDDIERHYARAVAAGAAITIELCEYDGGGRGYTCKDPEGHAWSFGSYNPWMASAAVPSGERQQHGSRLRLLSARLAMILVTAALSAAVAGGWLAAGGSWRPISDPASNQAEQMRAQVALVVEESGVLREALAGSVSREAEARSALQSSEVRLRALADQLDTAGAAIRARDEAVVVAQKQAKDANAINAELTARAEQAESGLRQERQRRTTTEKQAVAGQTALEEQQKQHRASQEAAREQYKALAAKLTAMEQAHRVALTAYEELISEKAASTVAAKPADAEPSSSVVREVRGAAMKREVKPAASRSASTAEPRLDRAKRRCAEVRRNPDDYEPELIQLCRAL